ncbi:MAG: hypothetical protein P4L40_21540 [Terracidiphilus sp.]|nr:hypothetical protein [Terracidiphilus sp.]
MDTSWISPALVGVGIVYSMWRDGQRDARREAKQETVQNQHQDWLLSHSKKIADLQTGQSGHGERIKALEALRDYGAHGD